jgi:hypothetical protein
MNGDVIILSFTLMDCLPISYTIHTVTKLPSELVDAPDVSSNVTAIKTVTDKLGSAAMLEEVV